jgi:hypothetical protein
MATDSARFNEKGYWSTDTENDGRRGATTWRREKKKRRRRKAEIYVSFSFVSMGQHWFNSYLDHSTYIISDFQADVHFEASSCHDDVWRPDTSSSVTDTEHGTRPRDLAILPVPPGCDVDSV